MFVFILVIVPPTLDQDAPTRTQANKVVEYWYSEQEWFKFHDHDGLDEAIHSLQREVARWGNQYDKHKTRKLRRILIKLRALRDKEPKVAWQEIIRGQQKWMLIRQA